MVEEQVTKIMCIMFNHDLNYYFRTKNALSMSTEFKLSSFLKALYCSLNLSLLEYSSIFWDPFTALNSSHIEWVQGRFCSSASFILQTPNPSHYYRPVMNELGLLYLADRVVEDN